MPIVVKTTGSYFEQEQFLNKIEGLKRSFLVTGFTLKSAEGADSSRPAISMLEIQGRVFLSPAAAAAAGATVPAPGATATPRPVDGPRGQLTRRLT